MATRHTLSLALLAWGIALPRMNADSFQIMHDFGGSPSGTEPLAGLIRDAAGNLYGTAEYGGDDNSGVVFRISPAGKYTLLHAFHGTDGAAPVAGLVEDQLESHGAASLGGRSHHGVIFKIDAARADPVLQQFHRRRRIFAAGRSHPGFRRKPLWRHRRRRRIRQGSGLQAGYLRKRNRAIQLHGRRGRLGTPRQPDSGLGGELIWHGRQGRGRG